MLKFVHCLVCYMECCSDCTFKNMTWGVLFVVHPVWGKLSQRAKNENSTYEKIFLSQDKSQKTQLNWVIEMDLIYRFEDLQMRFQIFLIGAWYSAFFMILYESKNAI